MHANHHLSDLCINVLRAICVRAVILENMANLQSLERTIRTSKDIHNSDLQEQELFLTRSLFLKWYPQDWQETGHTHTRKQTNRHTHTKNCVNRNFTRWID